MDSLSIGLDIGSSAVRAAELEIKDGSPVVRRFAQVGIPSGWVVDGEVVNVNGVAEAVKRLWAEGGFDSNKVVLGVSGPRVFVRQADVPAMDAADLRSSLRFDGQEMVPIALDESPFDFSILDHVAGPEGSDAANKLRILLVAAHRDVLHSYLEVAKLAGLSVVAMDSAALALLRAVPVVPSEPERSGIEVLVSIGSEMTIVAVRRQGIPLFIRSLTMGGARLTESMANSMHMEMAVAERIKRGAVPADVPQLSQARKALAGDIRDLAEDVRATVDFFLAQADGSTLDRLLVTGGAAQTAGLAEAIAGNLPCEVMAIAPFGGLPHDRIDLDADALRRAGGVATTAIGLALWPIGSPMIRLSILPEEIAQARQARRVRQMAVAGTLVVAVLLGMGGVYRELQVRTAEHATNVDKAQVATLTTDVSTLQASTVVHNNMLARSTMVTNVLKGDLDWVRMLEQLASVMPPQVSISSFTGTRTMGRTGTGVGSVTFSVRGPGDAKDAAQWIEALQKDPNFQTTWVSGISISSAAPGDPQIVSFSSTANITPAAQSNRWQKVSS